MIALSLLVVSSSLWAGGIEPAKDSVWNVMGFGAIGDGTTDNTNAFQKALDAAAAANGGTVSIPTGRYSFGGSLTVPREVTLRGVYAYAPSHAGIRDNSDEKPVYGSVLMPRANAGTPEGPPFILLQSNSTLQGVCVYYPDQKPDVAPPTAYPYTVAMRGNNPAIIDCELLNPFNAIDAGQNQRALIRNIHGQPIHTGVFVDLIYDIGRIENVHWNPWWSMQKDLFEWQKENGVGFIFGRTDWHYVFNTFCFGYNVGYKFIETKAGATNGNFLGIGADDCRTSVVIEQSSPIGILITNGEFVSIDGPDPTMVRVGDRNVGSVRFSNCAFWGPANRNAVIAGRGTIGFSDCTFSNWGCHDKPCYSIEATGGSVLIRGCEFKEDKPQISLGPGVKRAVVTDNLIVGKKRILNKAKGQAVVDNNATMDAPKKNKAKPGTQEKKR